MNTHEAVRARARDIAAAEFALFQHVTGDAGREQCQDDWSTFEQMRLSQFLTWPLPLLESYAHDFHKAIAAGRNLVMEKYARMMESTDPQRFAAEIAAHLPVLSPGRIAQQETIIETQLQWAAEFMNAYPKLGAGMRVLNTSQDSQSQTSLETYLRGELGTYGPKTLLLYGDFVETLVSSGVNLTERIVANTVAFAGFSSLADAEAAQARTAR